MFLYPSKVKCHYTPASPGALFGHCHPGHDVNLGPAGTAIFGALEVVKAEVAFVYVAAVSLSGRTHHITLKTDDHCRELFA